MFSSLLKNTFLKRLTNYCTVYYIKRVTETTTSKKMDIKDVAKEIRVILKKEFPATKFSVKSSRFSQGSSVDVSWADGPTIDQVDELIGHYGNSRSRFITTSRKHSAELVTQAIAAWRKKNPEYSHFTVTCKGDTSWGFRAEFDISEFYRGSFDLQDCERSLINDFIYGSAFDGTNLILPQENADDCEPETVSTPESELTSQVRLKPTTNSMTIGSLERIFRDSPHYLDFNQIKRLAKEKNITIQGRKKEAYISQIKAALEKESEEFDIIPEVETVETVETLSGVKCDCKLEVISDLKPEVTAEVVAETEAQLQAQPRQLNSIKQPAAAAYTVSMKDALQKAWDKAEAEYTANPIPDNYRILDEKVKAYELGYMLFGQDDRWTTPKTAPEPQEPVRDLTLELIDLQELLISKMEEVSQLKLKIAELQVERDAAKYNQQQPKKAEIAQIILTRDEGTIAESGTTATTAGWWEAEKIIRQWAATVSSPTRADKCRIVFEFADGKSFKLSSFGLMQQHRFKINLAQELLAEIQYMAGERIPEHMTQEDYQNYCKFCKIEPANYKRLLENWDIPA